MKKHSAKILTVILAASMILGSAAPSFAKAEEAAPAEEVIVLESVQDEELPAAEEKNEEDVFFEAENVPEEDADTEDTLPADTQEEEEETLPADAEPEDPESVSEEDADAEDADTEEDADAAEEVPAEEVPAPAVKALPAAAVAEASAAFAAEADEIAKNTGLTRELVTLAEPVNEGQEEVTAAQPFAYNGDTVSVMKEDGSAFGMWAAQDGTSAVLSGDQVKITYIPKTTSTYVGFYYGDNRIPSEWKEAEYKSLADGKFVFTVGKDKCGTALPIAIVKSDKTTTPSAQYYLAIPAAYKLEEEIVEAEPFDYDGDVVTFISAEGKAFGMWTRQDSSKESISGNTVKISYIPKQTTTYTAFYYGDIKVSANWADKVAIADGKLAFTVSKDKCGKAWPVAIVKADGTTPTSAQYYLAIPAEDKLEEEVAEAEPFDYDGDVVTFISAEGKAFGMWTRQDSSKESISGNTVKISYIPKQTTTYTAFYYGDIKVSANWADKVEIADGKLAFTVSKDKCGKAWPVAIVKADGTTPTSAQYYLAIPAEDKLEEEVAEAEPFDYDGDVVTFISAEGKAFGMWTRQDSSKESISGNTVKISYIPKQTTTYTAFYYGDIKVSANWADKVEIADGKLAFTVSKDKCGKAWPVAIVKADGTTPTSAQYYLAIPAEDKLEEEVAEAEPFDYDGDVVTFISAEGKAFGMWTRQDSSKESISGNTVKISYIPKQTTTYTAFYYGDIKVSANWADKVEIADGKLAFTVSKDKCGKAWPVAIVKADGTTPTSAQYYLAVPAEDKLEKEEPETEGIDLTITNKTGMFKVTTASLVTEDGQKYLVFALSGKSYDYMFPGTFEEASANGDGTEGKGNGKWLHYTENADGKWEFKMPVTDDMLTGENIPMVSISNAYYDSFLQGKNKLERAFFPRQFKINEEEKTLETGDYDVNEALTVTNNAKDLTVNKAELNTVGGPSSNNYAENLIVTLKETGFDKAFIGSAADAAAASETIAPAEGAFTLAMRKNKQGGEELFNYLEQDIVISFHDSASDTWKEYKVNASKKNMTLTVSALAEDEEIVNPTPAPTPEPAKTDGTTAAVDSSTGLPDGNYTPDAFSFSGGTGKLNITCTNISVRNGQAYATLQLSSKNITYVKAAGGTYYTQPSGSGTTVEIPVELNKNNRILALTTAMSTPHEVEYSIFPYLAAAAGVNAAEIGEGMTIGEEGKLDDKAPVIPGLTGGEEMKLENSEYLKIFKYDDGISLIEIDMTKNSVLDPEYLEKHKDENADDADAVEAAEDEEIINEETGEAEAKPAEEYVAEQYRKDIVKYLVAPEKADLPAGLEKQVVIIRRPVENLYVSSAESAAALDKLGLLDMVKTLGMEEEDVENETLKEALKDEKLFLAGKADEPDYKTIVKEKTGMGFMTGTLLPLNEDVMKDRNLTPDEKAEDLTAKEYKERLYDMTDKYATLGIPVLMDRSADEKNEKGAAEWIMVYGLLFDKEEEAKTILDNTLKELD